MSAAVDVLRAVLSPLTRTRLFRRIVGPYLLPPVERLLAWATHGRVQLSALLVPSLVLHTVGAKTGVLRRVPLMYTPDGQGRAIVAGTNFAGARHPAWTSNLLAHPDAEITVRGRRILVRAALLGDHERAEAWARIERQWPGYRAYERESARTVRLFRLQPVRAEHARHPAWTANLLARPDAEISVRGRRFAVEATVIPEAERDATWTRMEAQWPDYRNYERDSGRTARLILLTPVRRLH